MVLAVDVLLDGAPRAAEPDGVLGIVVLRDEARLDHERGLAAEDEVVVRVRLRPGRPRDRVALAEPVDVPGLALVVRALVVADRHAAAEVVDELPVPVGKRRRTARSGVEDRDRVDEAVDRAPLPANHEVDRVAVARRRLRHVRRRGRARRVGLPGRVGGPVVVVDICRQRAVRVEERAGEVEAGHVARRRAEEVRLLRTREHRARDRVVDERQCGAIVGRIPRSRHACLHQARAEREACQNTLERVRCLVVRREG